MASCPSLGHLELVYFLLCIGVSYNSPVFEDLTSQGFTGLGLEVLRSNFEVLAWKAHDTVVLSMFDCLQDMPMLLAI